MGEVQSDRRSARALSLVTSPAGLPRDGRDCVSNRNAFSVNPGAAWRRPGRARNAAPHALDSSPSEGQVKHECHGLAIPADSKVQEAGVMVCIKQSGVV